MNELVALASEERPLARSTVLVERVSNSGQYLRARLLTMNRMALPPETPIDTLAAAR